MFKQVKSAFFWYYLYRFRKKVITIVFLLAIAFFANAIYADVVEYLTLKEKLEYLEIALAVKWLIIIFNIVLSVYLVLTLFKAEKNEEDKKTQAKKKKNEGIISTKKSSESSLKFTKREEEFLKKDLKSKADLLVER